VSEQPDKDRAASVIDANKPLITIYDEDLDLAVQLREADAKQWGRDQTVLKQISKHAQVAGAGKGGASGEPASGLSST
jgi:hypothetical protein